MQLDISDHAQQLTDLTAPGAGSAGGVAGRRWRTAQSGGRPTGRNHNDAPSRSFAGPDRAANAAREATGGRVLGVQGADHNGQRGYRVRILEPGGRVRSLHIDPESGAVRD
ncbi:MAG: PepSY domain-containing protein [Synechococcaceae cyanobacterium SM1_2_3]|nr:PepSY domain-containing protein [Synechococcaceae cyanobacterium SM1_2_3]